MVMMKIHKGGVKGFRFCVKILRALFFTVAVLPLTVITFLPDKHLLFGALSSTLNIYRVVFLTVPPKKRLSRKKS